jgi:hypothetical protein
MPVRRRESWVGKLGGALERWSWTRGGLKWGIRNSTNFPSKPEKQLKLQLARFEHGSMAKLVGEVKKRYRE